MRIMAFGAHPDDVDFLCGGTLAKYQSEGHCTAIAIATNGEVGSPVLSKEETAALRYKEAKASADVIGAQFFWLGYNDEFLFNGEKVRRHFLEVIRQFDPDIIICPDKDCDYHPDHTAVGQIIWDIHVMTTVPNIETESPPCSKIPDIFFMDTVTGVNFIPEFFIDISAHMETKNAMIACHESQVAWMVSQYDIAPVELGITQSRLHGLQSGCKYAECFRRPKFYPGVTTRSGLLP